MTAEHPMKHLTFVYCLGLTIAACDGEPRLPAPQPTPVEAPTPPPSPEPPAPEPAQQIRVGEEVKATLRGHGHEIRYELTAPSNGVLVVRLTWDTTVGRLELGLAEKQFVSPSPLTGRVSVAAELKYQVSVADGNPWAYDDLVLPFV